MEKEINELINRLIRQNKDLYSVIGVEESLTEYERGISRTLIYVIDELIHISCGQVR